MSRDRRPRSPWALPLLVATLVATAVHAEDWRLWERPGHRVYAPARLHAYATQLTAALAAATAPAARLFGYHPPEPTVWVLHDPGAWFNGAAYTLLNRIELYGLDADFLLRGHTAWIPNVAAHEYGHLATLDLARRWPRLLGGILVGGVDTATGTGFAGAKGAALWWLPNERVPAWFSEGIAQWLAELAGGDRFDTTRRMLERVAWLEGPRLSWAELGAVAGKDFLTAELVYNHGYSFVRYLAERGGPAGLRRLLHLARDHDFAEALAATYGEPATALLAAWRREVVAPAAVTHLASRPWIYEGFRYHARPSFVHHPALDPAERWLAFVDEGEADFPTGRLVVAPFDDPEEQTTIVEGVADPPAWSPDGGRLLVAARRTLWRQGQRVYDLYLWDRRHQEGRWLSQGARLRWPTWHPTGATIAVAVRGDGSWDLAWSDPGLTTVTIATDLPWGWAVRALAYDPQGRLWGELVRGDEIDLAWFTPTGTAVTATLLDWPGSHERRPAVAPDGSIWFVSDRDGAFDLYRLTVSGVVERRTGAIGGVLEATVGTTAAVITVFHSHGPRLHWLPVTDPLHVRPVTDARWRRLDLPAPTTVPSAPDVGRPAPFRLGRPLLYPELQYLYGEPTAGAVLVLMDEIGSHELQLEALLGRNWDLNAIYRYAGARTWQPWWELRRYHWVADLGTDAGTLAVPFDYDTVRAGLSLALDRSLSLGFLVRADRLLASEELATLMGIGSEEAASPCGATLFFCGAEVELLGLLEETPSRVLAPVDFRGRSLVAALALRRSRSHTYHFDEASGEVRIERRMLSYGRLWGELRWAPWWGEWTVEALGRVGWIPADVDPFEEFYLGGVIFQLRRGEYRTYANLPGYADFSIHGEKLLQARAAVRWTAARRLGALGPILADALVLELAVDAGNAWAADRSWREVLGNLHRKAHGPSAALDPTDTRGDLGLLYDLSFDLRLQSILYDQMPWTSYLRLAWGLQDPEARTNPLPLRIYVGVGTGL